MAATKEMTKPQQQDLSHKLVGRLSAKYGVQADQLLKTLRDTAFSVSKNEAPFADTEIAAALILCEQHNLNPFAKEIYITRSRGKLLTIVPIDGWAKIVNSHPGFDGCTFEYHKEGGKLVAVTCSMYVRGREHPVSVPEYMDECVQGTEPWKKWPARMLRHKAYIQAARLCFGLSGIIDEDEAERMRYLGTIHAEDAAPESYLLTAEESLEKVEEVKKEQPIEGPPHAFAEVDLLIQKVRDARAKLSPPKRAKFDAEVGDFEGQTSAGELRAYLAFAEGL